MDILVGVKYQECTLEANMVGPRKNCEILSHTSAPPQHLSPFSRLWFPPKGSHVLAILAKAHGRNGKHRHVYPTQCLLYLWQALLIMILSPSGYGFPVYLNTEFQAITPIQT